MKRYLLILTLLLTFLANGMAGAGVVGVGVSDVHNASGYSPQYEVDAVSLTTDQHCTDCGQSSCDSGYGCANCLAHCGGALLASPPTLAAEPASFPVFSVKVWRLSTVYASLLRPPRLS